MFFGIDDLERIYLATIDDNLREIEDILAQLGIANIPVQQFRDLLHLSAKSLTGRWHTGRKVLRTQIALRLIPNYPESVLNVSLTIDAIVNLLDDLLDEILAKEQKASYILEMARLLSLLDDPEIPPRLRRRIVSYFNKCICIVIPEIVYRGKIAATSDFDERLRYSIQCYDAKSLVMDIFMELPLVELFGDDDRVDELVALARVHRAVALIKKDYHDLEHDKQNQTETPLVLLSYEGDDNLRRYMDAMMAHYRARVRAITPPAGEAFSTIASNIRELIDQELRQY